MQAEKRKRIACLTLLAISAGILAWSYLVRLSSESEFNRQAVLARKQAQEIQSKVVLFRERLVPSGLSFEAALHVMGVDSRTAARLGASVRPVFDLRRLRAGNRLAVGRSVLGELRAVRYEIDPGRILWIARRNDEFHAEVEALPYVTETVGVAGEIQDSLFEAVAQAGESPELAQRLADIFGWDLDFYTDPRPGDTFRAVVEKRKLANGATLSYGRILAAEYDNDGRIYRAVLFHDRAGRPAYFTPNGKSMKKAFLRSPLKFAAPVTSHFSMHRFHPILKIYRPHLGTDYAAPMGTPVQAIGGGRVVFAGREGSAGKLVEVQHANGYRTYYLHLSRLFVRAGQRVVQGQRIGLVGVTGLATGPHLDFRIQRHGRFVNFERLPLPPSSPVWRRDWAEFAAARDRWLNRLPGLPAAVAGNRTPARPFPDSSAAQ